MRTLVAVLSVTLDGVAEAPELWQFPYLDRSMAAAVVSLHARSDTLLLGRVTYESMAAVWPSQTGELADLLNGTPKVVVSTTLRRVWWQNSAVLGGDAVGELTRLKRRPGKDITLVGSITLARSLLVADLIDELHLFVHPIVRGHGRRLLTPEMKRLTLVLVDSLSHPAGVLETRYRLGSRVHAPRFRRRLPRSVTAVRPEGTGGHAPRQLERPVMSIFVNLPVKELSASLGFFTELGFDVDERLTDDQAGCVVLGDGAFLMLVSEPFFKSITGRDIPDTAAGNEAVLAVTVDGRTRVDEILTAALANGGTRAGEAEDNEFMYSRGFHDLDGHLWQVLHMS